MIAEVPSRRIGLKIYLLPKIISVRGSEMHRSMLDTFAVGFLIKTAVEVALNWHRKSLSHIAVHVAMGRALPAQLHNFRIEQVDIFSM